MPSAPAAPSRPVVTGSSLAAPRAHFETLGEPPFRVEQLFRAVWKEGKTLDEGTTLSKPPRARLLEAVAPAATTVVEVEESAEGTTTWLLGLAAGVRVETVRIPEGERRTVCVSTPVGCPIRCVCCASGVGGRSTAWSRSRLRRSLRTAGYAHAVAPPVEAQQMTAAGALTI